MKNLLKAELFRLSKQRSTWIILLVLSVLSFFMAFYVGIVFGTSPLVVQSFERVKEIYEEVGAMALFTQIEETRNLLVFDSVYDFAASNVGSISILSMCVFAIFFYLRPQLNGTARSMVNAGHRNHMVLVNAIFIFAFSVVSVCVNAIMVLPGSFAMFSGSPVGSLKDYIIYILIMILLEFAAGLLVQFIVFLARRPFMGIMFSFFYVTALSSIFYEMIDKAVEVLFHLEMKVERFTVFGAISTLKPGEMMNSIYALIAGVFFSVLAIVLSILLNKKRNY